MVIFFEQSVVFNRPLLELHVYAAAVDADDASDATDGVKDRERRKDVSPHKRTQSVGLSAGGVSYSTLSMMRVLSFMVAVRAKPLVAGDDM